MIKKFFLKHKTILLLLILALLLRLPWLYTTIHKDEGQFGYVAWRWLDGRDLYVDLKDNKPPLLYALYSAPIFLFGNSIVPVRILNDVLFLVSIIFFFKLVKSNFSKKVSLYSSLFYSVFMSIPAFDGYFALSESLLTPFLIVSVYFFERYVSTKRACFLFMSSVFASISSLIKQQSVFIFFLLILGLFVYKEKCKVRKAVFLILVPMVIMALMLLINPQVLLFLLNATWYSITKSPLGFSFGYRHYPYNLLIFIEGSILFLFSAIGLVSLLKSKKNEKDYFFILWLCLALVFALVPPAYGRYWILMMPPAAVFAGIGVNCLVNFNKKLFVLLIVPLLLVTGMLAVSQFPDSRLDTKYLKYRWSAFDSYDQQIGLIRFVKGVTSPADKIFVFEWEPSVYWLSERVPPKVLGFSYNQNFANQSYLKDVLREVLMNQKDLKMIIFLHNYTFISDYFDFLPDKTVVYGISVYEWRAGVDYCYLNLAYKSRNENICELISTSFFKSSCHALSTLDYRGCYNPASQAMTDFCLFTIASDKKDARICEKINDRSMFDFCTSILKGEFDHASCTAFFSSKYGKEFADYKCKRYYARFINSTSPCNDIQDPDRSLLCMGVMTSDKAYCKNISNRLLYAYCMSYTTSDINYCVG